ncbi:4-hydroxy-tetrahydrodipicolinate reductase [Clostridia bacterium]|nr:4-hydroxy-tetrahydrodipicolinate reductase [Clostridia bacterium]
MLRIVICGANGKMGKVIYNCLASRDNFEVIGGIDIDTNSYADFQIVKSANELPETPDVIIDYSHPNSLNDLLSYAKSMHTPLVLATTGYDNEQIAFVKKASSIVPIFFSWNMSLGINLLLSLSKKAASVLGDDFDIEIVEKHHNQKLDAPSGTALMLADAINDTDKPYRYEYDRHSKRGKRPNNEIGIHSVRGGTIVGEHEVLFAGRDEIISLKHIANSKEIFAVGSINAAAFLVKQENGLYTMDELVS